MSHLLNCYVSESIIKLRVENAVKELILNKSTEGCVMVLVDGAFGQYIPEIFAKMMGVPFSSKEEESYWDDFISLEEEMGHEIVEEWVSKWDLPDEFFVYYGTLEGGGDLALMVGVEEDYWKHHDVCEECEEVFDDHLVPNCTKCGKVVCWYCSFTHILTNEVLCIDCQSGWTPLTSTLEK